MITFHVWCQDERKTVATMEFREDTEITVEAIVDAWEPSLADYALGEGYAKDGVQMLCPKCSAPLLLREDDPEKTKGVYLVPGALKTGTS